MAMSTRSIAKRWIREGTRRCFHPSTSVISDPLGMDKDFGKDRVVFPRSKEEKGIDYELNWSLNAEGVVPNVYAFRNLDEKSLLSRSNGSLTKEKALISNGKHVEVKTSSTESNDLFESVKEKLSNVVDVFVQDGALGSHASCESRVRIVTDSPDLALATKHILVKVPLRSDAREQDNHVNVYVATGMENGQETNAAVADRSEDGTRTDVAVAGSTSFASLLDLVQKSCEVNFSRDGALALRCSTYVNAKGQTVLVFTDDSAAPLQPLEGDATLFGAHHNLWAKDGIVRTFAGALFHASVEKERGSVVLESEGGSSVQSVPAAVNVAAHPHLVLFHSKKAENGPVKDAKTVRSWFKAAGHSDDDAAAFEARVKEHGVRVVGAKTPAQANKALGA